MSANFQVLEKVPEPLRPATFFGDVAMQPKTEGSEEKGPSDLPFINDPEKPTSPPLNDADATEAAEAEEDIEDDGQPI